MLVVNRHRRDFFPHLQKIQIGVRNHGFALSSIERLIQQLAEATPTAAIYKASTAAATAARDAPRKSARVKHNRYQKNVDVLAG